MARPPVDKRLQNIEQGIADIEDMLCKIICSQQDDVAAKDGNK